MIGVSLPFAWLNDGGKPYGEPEPFFARLKAAGVTSAEIRAVRPDADPLAVRRAAERLWNSGLRITVHGTVLTDTDAVTEVFRPLEALLADLRQEAVNITVHPIPGDNRAMLDALAAHIERRHLPVTLALENNRRLPDKTEGDSVAVVVDAIEAIDAPCVGACWDMGHYAYYVRRFFPDRPDLLPDERFLRRVIHTHIHALDGLTTHFPLDTGELPLARYRAALGAAYGGALDLELEPSRFADRRDPAEALLSSVAALKAVE